MTVVALSKTDQIKEIILRDIKRGALKPGDALPSIQRLALRHSVSKHTVSQAVSNLNELGVVMAAQGKVTRVSPIFQERNIVIIHAGSSSPAEEEFWSDFYNGAAKALDSVPNIRRNTRPLPAPLTADSIRNIEAAPVAGVLLMGTALKSRVRLFKKFSIPAVMIYDIPDDAEISGVSVDFHESFGEICRLLASNGKKRAAYINRFEGEDENALGAMTIRALKKSMLKHGMTPDDTLFRNSLFSLEQAHKEVCEMLRMDNPPDSFILSTDFLAPAVIRAVQDSGLRVPEDIPLSSCDNLSIGKFLSPSLTTISIPRVEIGKRAAEILLDMIDGKRPARAVRVFMKSSLIIRESLR